MPVSLVIVVCNCTFITMNNDKNDYSLKIRLLKIKKTAFENALSP